MSKIKNNKIFDKEFRKNITSNPSLYARELDSSISTDVVVKKNTRDIIYVVIPNENLLLDELKDLSAAGKFGLSSFSTLCTTMSTVSSVET